MRDSHTLWSQEHWSREIQTYRSCTFFYYQFFHLETPRHFIKILTWVKQQRENMQIICIHLQQLLTRFGGEKRKLVIFLSLVAERSRCGPAAENKHSHTVKYETIFSETSSSAGTLDQNEKLIDWSLIELAVWWTDTPTKHAWSILVFHSLAEVWEPRPIRAERWAVNHPEGWVSGRGFDSPDLFKWNDSH